MGRLSRTRLRMLQVLKNPPQDEAINLKLRLRSEEEYKIKVATAFACRELSDMILPTQAEITRAIETLELWYTQY